MGDGSCIGSENFGNYPCRGRKIIPVRPIEKKVTFKKIMRNYSRTCFEARNVADGAYLGRKMIKEGDTIWMGVAGAVMAGGGLDGYLRELMKRGFINAICITGAQVYHSLHFAFDLPVWQGHPRPDDDMLRQQGITRIYDINIKENETLIAQDELLRDFCLTLDNTKEFSSASFNNALGNYIQENAPYPARSFLSAAARYKVPVYCDSTSNSSIHMNLAKLYTEGHGITISSSLDILESAAIVFGSKSTGFIELGGGGPKNFIQQTSPTIKQIFGIDFEGADRGLQITTANVLDGGLSGCTFSEGVTWNKYQKVSRDLVQIFGEYSVIFPLIAGYILENCKPRKRLNLMDKIEELLEQLKSAKTNSC